MPISSLMRAASRHLGRRDGQPRRCVHPSLDLEQFLVICGGSDSMNLSQSGAEHVRPVAHVSYFAGVAPSWGRIENRPWHIVVDQCLVLYMCRGVPMHLRMHVHLNTGKMYSILSYVILRKRAHASRLAATNRSCCCMHTHRFVHTSPDSQYRPDPSVRTSLANSAIAANQYVGLSTWITYCCLYPKTSRR